MAVLPRPAARRLRRSDPALGLRERDARKRRTRYYPPRLDRLEEDGRAASVPGSRRAPDMQFGFTLKPEHTIDRTLALTRQAEAAGFDYGWLFDSHVLWREPYVLLTLMAQATTDPSPGDVRDQPGDPGAERDRVGAGRPRRDLRRPDGPRHRSRRLGPARPGQAADHDGRRWRRRSSRSRRSSRAGPSSTRARSCACRGPGRGRCRSGSRATVRWHWR